MNSEYIKQICKSILELPGELKASPDYSDPARPYGEIPQNFDLLMLELRDELSTLKPENFPGAIQIEFTLARRSVLAATKQQGLIWIAESAIEFQQLLPRIARISEYIDSYMA